MTRHDGRTKTRRGRARRGRGRHGPRRRRGSPGPGAGRERRAALLRPSRRLRLRRAGEGRPAGEGRHTGEGRAAGPARAAQELELRRRAPELARHGLLRPGLPRGTRPPLHLGHARARLRQRRRRAVRPRLAAEQERRGRGGHRRGHRLRVLFIGHDGLVEPWRRAHGASPAEAPQGGQGQSRGAAHQQPRRHGGRIPGDLAAGEGPRGRGQARGRLHGRRGRLGGLLRGRPGLLHLRQRRDHHGLHRRHHEPHEVRAPRGEDRGELGGLQERRTQGHGRRLPPHHREGARRSSTR